MLGIKNSSYHISYKGRANRDYGSKGAGASRFFYIAKTNRVEKEVGCEGLKNKKFTAGNYSQSPVCKTCGKTINGINDHSKCSGEIEYREMKSKEIGNNHPCVKPISLIRYLVKMVKMPNDKQVILDPFMGSGSTGMACILEDRNFIGIEMEKEYFEIAKKRIEYTKNNPEVFEIEKNENGFEKVKINKKKEKKYIQKKLF